MAAPKHADDLTVTLRMLNDLIYKIQKDARRQDHPAARKLLEMAWMSDQIVDGL